MKICTKCGKKKHLDNYRLQRSNAKYPYRLNYCNECRKLQSRALQYKSPENYLRGRFTRKKAWSKQFGVKFTLKVEDILELYSTQKGKCFYTGVPMCWDGSNHRYAISFDRIDNDKGYTKRNTVLCLTKVNTAKADLTLDEIKKWMPSWYRKITKFWIR